jgi:hypothetical protein
VRWKGSVLLAYLRQAYSLFLLCGALRDETESLDTSGYRCLEWGVKPVGDDQAVELDK